MIKQEYIFIIYATIAFIYAYPAWVLYKEPENSDFLMSVYIVIAGVGILLTVSRLVVID